jgi:hypothetical protein
MQTMQIGIATTDITPPIGVTLWGYNPRTADAVGHALRAEALACQGENGGWLLLTADVGAFSWPLATRLREEIAGRTGLAPAAVMITGTHTHSGPHVTDALWREGSELESAYFRTLQERLVEMAVRAWASRRPGELVVGQATAPELGSNRRVQREDGTWTNAWSDPEGTHTGYFDATVDLLGVRRPDGTLDALLVNYGCHPVGFGSGSLAISGDYVSYLKDALEAAGATRTALFTVSGHANVDPRHCVQADPAVVRRLGEALAAIVREALPGLAPVGATRVAAALEPWQFSTTWDIGGRMLIYFAHAGKGKPVSTAIGVLAAGSVALLGLPGETVSEYRAKFRQRSPFPHTFLISIANDFVGYLPTDEILRQGAYEAMMSPLNPIEDALTARADAALRAAHARLAAGPR